MGMTKENPRYNVVSLRLNDDEYKALQTVAAEKDDNLSGALRDLMVLGMEARNNPSRGMRG